MKKQYFIELDQIIMDKRNRPNEQAIKKRGWETCLF
tara:strand:+ start:1132 stop:1239 length:108 start_codon:yes stop_codon:yes gene_type:complete